MRKLQRQANYSEMSSLPLRLEVLGPSTTQQHPSTIATLSSDAAGSPNPPRSQSPARGHQSEHDAVSGNVFDQLNEVDEEKNFGLFPCPATLRAVVEYVLSTVTEKLTLSHVGSLKDCMRYTFECRSLLDKLLKEIPSYHHFAEHNPQTFGGGGGGGVSSARVQELYQEFRRIPVVLPQAKYAQSKETGQFLPEIGVGKTTGSGALSPRDDMLAAHHSHHHAGAAKHRIPHHPAPPRSGGGGLKSGLNPLSPTQQHLLTANMRNVANAASHQRDRELLLRHLRRQTQMTSESVQTDDNMHTTVSRAAYDDLLDEIAILKVELCDRHATLDEMIAKQNVALGVINTKANTVSYLRGTLYKECCILRQQLAVAHQRIQVLQMEGGGGATMRGGQLPGLGQSILMAGSIGSGGGGTFSQSTIQHQLDSDIQMNGVHALLDLALLAVEKDKVLGPNGELLPNQNAVVAKLKDEMQQRQMKWKRDIVNIRGKFVLVLEEKNRQMKSVQLASNATHLRAIIRERINELRADFSKNRFAVREMLAEMRNSMTSLVGEIRTSLFKVDDTLLAGRSADFERRACGDLVLVAATQLLRPMLCEAYCFSNPSFLSRHRLGDPLVHYCQHTLPTQEMCQALVPECEALQNLYAQIHRFVVTNMRQPEVSRPCVGPEFKKVALGLMANPNCVHEMLMSVRTLLEVDAELASRLVGLNFKLKAVSHQQRAVQARSERSFTEAGIDPTSHMLPVMPLVNRIGVRLGKLRNAKAETTKDRANNARELYKLWAESGLTLPGLSKRIPYRMKDPNITVNVTSVSPAQTPTSKAAAGDFPAANVAGPKWAGGGGATPLTAAISNKAEVKKKASGPHLK